MLKAVNRQGRGPLRETNRQASAPPSNIFGVPAPIGGVNTRDAFDAMPPTDAIRLINLIPDALKVVTRPGYASHGTGVGSGDVEMLAVWKGPAGQKLIAAGDGELYDASSAGAASVITATAGYSSDQWQTTNFAGRLFGFNGVDAPWDYDGTTLTSTSWTGPTATDLIQATVYKARLYIVEKDSASFWYPASGAVTGALTEFDLSTVTRFGGKLMAVGVWSTGSGQTGQQAYFVAVMETGAVLIYAGDNPATTWAIVGEYKTAPPIGRRCLQAIGGDLIILTELGPMPVSLIARGWAIEQIQSQTMWGKPTKLFTDYAAMYRSVVGWEISPLFSNGRVYVNVPRVASSIYGQIACYMPRGAWCELAGLSARTWAEYDGEIYFGGGGGVVYKHSGLTDAGSDITFNGKGAFDYLGARNRIKKVNAMRLVLLLAGTATVTIGADRDFSDMSLPSGINILTAESDGSAWDADDWDDADWASEPTPLVNFVTAGGEGRNFAPRFFGSTSVQIEWFSTDYLYALGGLL